MESQRSLDTGEAAPTNPVPVYLTVQGSGDAMPPLAKRFSASQAGILLLIG